LKCAPCLNFWGLSCQPLPRGNRVAILTNAGGPAALASDALAANGFELASISEERQAELAAKLNPSAQVANPVDMLGGAEPAEFSHCLSTLLDDPDVDVFLPILVPQSLVDPGAVAQAIVDNANKTDKTVLACMVGEKSLKDARRILHRNRVPMSTFPDIPGKVLGAMRRYQDWLTKKSVRSFQYPEVDPVYIEKILSKSTIQVFGEAETRPILEAYGLDLAPGALAEDAENAVEIAGKIGYPVVVKIVSPQILHKSDKGGIALGLRSDLEVQQAVEKMFEQIIHANPQAEIHGYLVEKMAPKGLEVIIGMRRDPTFGPLMMFGFGGVTVELFKDVGFGVAPLTPSQARDMIEVTKAGQLLEGYRGGPRYDIEAVVDTIGRLSQIALDHPSISEIEINPLIVFTKGKGAQVLDARMILLNE